MGRLKLKKPLLLSKHQKIKMQLQFAKDNPSLITEHSKDWWLSQIKENLQNRYNQEPCSEEELMKEADQFAPVIWEVYAFVDITRNDVLEMVKEIRKHGIH